MNTPRPGVLRLVLRPLLSLAALATACSDPGSAPPAPTAGASVALSSASAPAPAAAPRAAELQAPLTGGVVARVPGTETLVVADEDHRALHITEDARRASSRDAFESVELPGAPAQVVAWGDTILVTIRDPGLLIRLERTGRAAKETGRISLPADAWGLAVTRDAQRAVVTSAWTHKVTVLDLEKLTPITTVDVAREPRGVTLTRDGQTAFVSHLVGTKLTYLSLDGAAATEAVTLPASPLRAPSGKALEASLGYALALSPGDDRLYVARHALGAMGREAWFGAATVDVLRPKTKDPIAPVHQGNAMVYRSAVAKELDTPDTKANLPADPLAPFTQPRDIRYRATQRTLLVVGEGDNTLAELDAQALDPTLSVLRTFRLGTDVDPNLGGARTCGAPSGLALSEDEATAYVFCRSTYDLARVDLAGDPYVASADAVTPVRLGEDPVGDEVNIGRRLFYDATDEITSGGLGCAGCHPEGRDDGFVWHEASFDTPDGGTRSNFVGTYENIPDLAKTKGVARRTVMLAGRVRAEGPYGWRAESTTLAERIGAGMGLHRWGGLPKHAPENVAARAGYLAVFVRRGLVTPPRPGGVLSPVAERGKRIFEAKETACATCHRPDSDFSDRVAYPLKALPARTGFDDEPKAAFKTPSLLFLDGRAPYFHDGSASSLERLVETNQDRMGKTSHLSADDRAALVAYLRTL